MDQQNPTLAKRPILDTGKFEQWQFRIQQYLQHEHYALWEVIEFGDSYEAPAVNPTTGSASDGTGKKKGMTITLTANDMQKRKNDAAILKTFGGNEATKKTKKNLLKQQYGNFKAEGSETLEQMLNRLQIDKDDMEEIDIKWNMALLSMRADRFWKKISIQGTYMAGFDKSKALKVLMAIDGVGWDWSYMANDEENHALIADEETPTEFALMAKTSAESEVFDNSLCSKAWSAQVEARLAEHKSQELKYYEKEKGKLETKLTGFQTASKDLYSLLESQRLDKNKEGLGYSVVPPPPAQIYSPPKKDMSWTGLPKFKNDTVTDYSRPHLP
nr:hypothetical protein [Tanacetum cinerariifolium]